MPEPPPHLSVYLRSLRLTHCDSQASIAAAAGISAAYLCRIETGSRRPPAHLVAVMAARYSCTVEDLLRDAAAHPAGLAVPQVDDQAAFGATLRRLRRARRLTQNELGTAIGVSGAYICRMETGNGRPSRRVLTALERCLGVPAVDLIAPARQARRPRR